MKTINFLFFLLLFTFSFSISNAEFTIDWDENDPLPDGYRLFSKIVGSEYDYSSPIWEGLVHPVTINTLVPSLPEMPVPVDLTASYEKTTNEVTATWVQPPDPIATENYNLVVRAYLNTGEESADSNEVEVEQSKRNALSKWEVYYSETAGGPYISLGEVLGGTPGITQPITAVAEGEIKTIYFTVVAFGESGSFSANSSETSVVIDRRVTPVPPQNINVTVTIPVQ